MGPVARDQDVAAMVDGGGKYRSVLLGQDHGVRQQAVAGDQAADADSGGHGVQHREAGGSLGGQITTCLLDDVSVGPQLVSGAFAERQQLSHRAIGARRGEQNVGVEENPHRVSATSFSARRPIRPPPRRIRAGARRCTAR